MRAGGLELREALHAAVDSLRAHALRSLLTTLGMLFGVGAVLAMLAIGSGAEREALALVDALGVRNVLLRAREPARSDELYELRKLSPGLGPRDADALAAAVPGIERLALKRSLEPYHVGSAHGRAKPRVLGVSVAYATLANLRLAEGRWLDALDEREHAQVCVLGAGVRRDLFGLGVALGGWVKVDEQWLAVVGVLQPTPGAGREIQGFTVAGTANDIYLPVSTLERKFPAPPLRSPLDEIVVALEPGRPVPETAAVVAGVVERLHGGADDFTLVVPATLVEQSRRTQRLFDLVMGSIAGISLLVGGIGIMNIMLATVFERTREIGVRRAVGATRTDIRNQFLIEAFVLSAAGGLLGVGCGAVLARAVAFSAGWQTHVSPAAVLLACAVALVVGLASGLYPARRAARLDPIDALRHE